MKTGLVLSLAVLLAAPTAFAGEATPVKVEFKFQSDRSVEANYETIQDRAASVCRETSRRSDTFTRNDTAEIVANCKSELVDAAVAALGVSELSDMHGARS